MSKKKTKFVGDVIKERQQKEAEERAAKLEKLVYSIRQTNTTIFLFAQALIDHIDKLKDDDHNFKNLNLGNKNYLVQQRLKKTANEFLKELDKSVNSQKQLFTEEYLETQEAVIAIINEIAEHFGMHNIEKIQAIAKVLLTDDPTHLIQYYTNRKEEQSNEVAI